MKKLVLMLSIAIVLTMLSCSKDAGVASTEERVTLSAQELIDLYIRTDAVFQFSTLIRETGEEYGWVIDREGYLRSYRSETPRYLGNAVRNELWNANQIEELLAIATEPRLQVGAQDLVEVYKEALKISAESVSDISLSPGAAAESRLSVFRLTTPDQVMSGGCGSMREDLEGADARHTTYFEKVMIESTGYQLARNNSPSATVVARWVSDLEGEF